jgi:hypothetical protein
MNLLTITLAVLPLISASPMTALPNAPCTDPTKPYARYKTDNTGEDYECLHKCPSNEYLDQTLTRCVTYKPSDCTYVNAIWRKMMNDSVKFQEFSNCCHDGVVCAPANNGTKEDPIVSIEPWLGGIGPRVTSIDWGFINISVAYNPYELMHLESLKYLYISFSI